MEDDLADQETSELQRKARERERALDTDMAEGTAACSRDVYAAVARIDFYGGFKEMLLHEVS